ncbi:Na(+)/H(+) antiporter subunit D [Desulfocurvibacter africanus]|uniref:NADH dehydrogenase (Quinone) n=1 Tax=Desulfocurvibacter africanus subsp. africanus str. Walvis Bay TaxID=690850 RepID=F3YYT8_DESAF|nr:Na(+)/H(+) antiporter subunit D [Desulfocurvibacter africanus]EGJ51914.1 NADH dehydrogenase (quinone) [Desulfocurvibacter africanus subsp. africanus str. Walvis Bay]
MDQIFFSGTLPPSLIFILGAMLVPALSGRLKQVYLLMLPLAALLMLMSMPNGMHWNTSLLGYDLVLGRIDGLSRAFGYIFSLVSFIAVLFALQVKDDIQHVAGLCYAGAALGVTFAGDLISLYIFWEIMAVASTFLILARRTKSAHGAAFRYIMVHIVGGLLLLAGVVMKISQTGTTAFDYIGLGLNDPASILIFLGIAINAAIPPLHSWLQDAYPEATATGAVFLSAFTTKSAVYLMARTYPGTELLIWLGAAMAAIPIFYAVLENDLRRVLAYSLINQVGFMMVGVGIGSELAINGTVAHAFCHILYKALLFMSIGAVMHMTGRSRCTDLGGLYRTMPLTCLFCIIGAASISAFPLFSGFVSKSMIISATGHGKIVAVWLILQFASAGVFHHAGIKVPFFTFFGHDSGLRPKEPPLNMLLAMGIAAFLCVYLGVNPGPLYSILPFPVEYVPYTGAHVVAQLQLLMFGALAFTLLILSGKYPAEIRAINLDTDWFYRKGGRLFYVVADKVFNGINAVSARLTTGAVRGLAALCDALPATVAVIITAPVNWLSGSERRNGHAWKAFVQEALATGTVPTGATILVITLGLACLVAVALVL